MATQNDTQLETLKEDFVEAVNSVAGSTETDGQYRLEAANLLRQMYQGHVATDLMDLNAFSPQLFFPGEADVHCTWPLAQMLRATTSKTLGTPSNPTDTETTPAIDLETQYDLEREGTDRQDSEELDLVRQRIENTYRQVWRGFYN